MLKSIMNITKTLAILDNCFKQIILTASNFAKIDVFSKKYMIRNIVEGDINKVLEYSLS